MKRFARTLFPALLISCSAVLSASEWSLYRGPDGNGTTSETIKVPWASSGPKVVWKVPVSNGFSSFTIGNGEAFTQVSHDGREFCVALDAATGKELWSTDIDQTKYSGDGNSGTPDNKGGEGPRSTPAYSDGQVFAYTPAMVLYCLDAKTGKQVWVKDMIKEFGGHNLSWNNAMSPVIDGEMLFVAAGGTGQSFVAFYKKSGEVAWKSGTEAITHATPVAATILDHKQVIFFVKFGLVSLDEGTGKELWRYPLVKFSTSTAASPVVCGDIVYCSAGYDVGAGACKISKSGSEFSATQIYRIPGNKLIPNHWSTPVYKDGYLYGMFSFKRYGVGPLKCVEAATGKIMWEQKGFGAGNVILAHDKLLALADDGELVAVVPTPSGYKEISRFQAVAGKCWSTPALSDGHVYVRSTKEAACIDLSGK